VSRAVRTRSGLGALAAALAALAPGAARAGPTASGAVLELAATRLLLAPAVDGRARAIPAEALRLVAADRGDDGDASDRLPACVRRIFWRWDTYDGQGYGFRPGGGRDGWFVGGEYERRQGPQPLVIEPEEEPDSPRRRVVGDDARSVGAVVDLSRLPRLLLALGAGGGRRHLHAYLGWAVTVPDPPPGR
jgi:hypothetical protein